MNLPKKYTEVRQRTVDICAPLSVEDHGMQPVDFASPAKWHLAHTSWFFETFILTEFYPRYQLFNDSFPYYFNSYYQAKGERQPRNQRGWLSRPSVEKVYEYRAYVDKHMLELLNDAVHVNDISQLLEIGLNHEQQHQELLFTDIKFGLGVQPFHPKYADQPLINEVSIAPAKEKDWVEMPGGLYTVGHNGDGFAFDNEYNQHTVYLEPYKLANSPVTCGEYIEFIEAGGYQNFEYWHDEGWAWVEQNDIKLPLYWETRGDSYARFSLSGLIKIDPNSVLQHVNFYEASAFAAWKGLRLPTEIEWEAAAEQFEWGAVWEWTNSAYLPYPGYVKPAGAVGEYNGKFMINQMVLRGSSIATSPNHSRKTYRNFFHPQFQWQYSGIRLASNL